MAEVVPMTVFKAPTPCREMPDERTPGWGCPPGAGLAWVVEGCAAGALTDHGLVEMMRAAQRLVSWSMARQLAAMAELDRRRTAQAHERGSSTQVAAEMMVCEVAAALTVSDAIAAIRAAVAWKLDGPLAATRHALEQGRIDFDKARAICDAVTGLRPQITALVERGALEQAERLTLAQLRPLLRTLVAHADPHEAAERKTKAVAGRRLELRPTGEGTMDLSGRDLPEHQAHAAYNRINAIATARKTDGDTRPIDQIRADVFTDLLRTTHPSPTDHTRPTPADHTQPAPTEHTQPAPADHAQPAPQDHQPTPHARPASRHSTQEGDSRQHDPSPTPKSRSPTAAPLHQPTSPLRRNSQVRSPRHTAAATHETGRRPATRPSVLRQTSGTRPPRATTPTSSQQSPQTMTKSQRRCQEEPQQTRVKGKPLADSRRGARCCGSGSWRRGRGSLPCGNGG